MPTPRIYASAAERQRAYRQRQEEARRAELERKGLPALPAIPTMPGVARWTALVAEATQSLFKVACEMEMYFDDRSEQWQQSERGEQIQARVEFLQTLIGELDGWTVYD